MDKTELFNKAIEAYQKHCSQLGAIFQQPNKIDSTVGWKYVTLRNINGVLCRYNIKAKTIEV